MTHMAKHLKTSEMKRRVDKLFDKKPELRNFNYLFTRADPEDRRVFLEYVTRLANEDQRRYMEEYQKRQKAQIKLA